MAKKLSIKVLYLYMNGIHVGSLHKQANDLQFIYAQEWLQWEYTRPISLSMPLTEIAYKGEIVNRFFDNLLPDSELIRDRIQVRFSSPSKKCFDLLSYIGRDCVGALQILTQPKVSNVKKITAQPISEQMVAKLLKHYQTAPLGMDPTLDFRISIAGAQEKTALLWHEQQWHLPQGLTPTSHIIKLPIGRINHSSIDLTESVENEWLCLAILAAYNLPVNKASITHFEDVKALVVERFDRQWSENHRWLMRLPQEDMCQALGKPAALKYEADGGPGIKDVMNILLGSKNALLDRERFMKTVFIFWVLAAIDGHAKNFSIALGPQGAYELTPIYDVLSAYPIVAKHQLQWKNLKMAMSLKSKNRHYHWQSIQARHWLAMARECRFPENRMQDIIAQVCDEMENVITQVTATLPRNFPEIIAESIFSGMRKIKNQCVRKTTS